MEIKWEYLLALAIVIVAGIAWIAGKASEESFIALVGMLFAFVTGRYAVTLAMKMAKSK